MRIKIIAMFLLSAALAGAAVMPANAAEPVNTEEMSAESSSFEENAEDCATEDAADRMEPLHALEKVIEEDDDIAVEFDTQEEEAIAEEDAGIEGELDSWVGDIGETDVPNQLHVQKEAVKEEDDTAVEFDTQEEEAIAEEDAGIEGELNSWVGDIGETDVPNQLYVQKEAVKEEDDIAVEFGTQEEEAIAEEDAGIEGESDTQEECIAEENVGNQNVEWQDEVKTMNLISSESYDVDDEFAVEVSDYESRNDSVRAASMTSVVEYNRSWRIYRKSNNETVVQWVLRGIFEHNGKTSRCKYAKMSCHNSSPGTYRVTSKTGQPSGIYAVGYCRAVNKKTGKVFSQMIKFGVTPTGKIIKR